MGFSRISHLRLTFSASLVLVSYRRSSSRASPNSPLAFSNTDAHISTMPKPSHREKLLSAGLHVVLEQGYCGASVRDIVQAQPIDTDLNPASGEWAVAGRCA